MGNVILIGFMGCGKSSIGKRLAEKIGYCYCDTDRMIERDCNKSISELFETEGEEHFRALETKTVKNLIGTVNNCIISVGGGLPIKEGNGKLLQQLGIVIYLKVTKDTIMKRLEYDKTRPLLASNDRDKKIDELLRYREPIYKSTADIIIEVDEKEFEQILDDLTLSVMNKEKLSSLKLSNELTRITTDFRSYFNGVADHGVYGMYYHIRGSILFAASDNYGGALEHLDEASKIGGALRQDLIKKDSQEILQKFELSIEDLRKQLIDENFALSQIKAPIVIKNIQLMQDVFETQKGS